MFAVFIGGVADILLGERGQNLAVKMFFIKFDRNFCRNSAFEKQRYKYGKSGSAENNQQQFGVIVS